MRLFRPLPLALSLVSLVSCSTNQLVRSWQPPNQAPPRFSSLLILAAVSDEFAGRIYEDAFVKYAQGAGITATPGWSVMKEGAFVTKEQLEAGAVTSGAAAVLISKVVHVNVETDYNYAYGPAAYSPGFYGYYNAGFLTYVSDSQTNVAVTVQTNVYEVRTQELVWSGITKSYPNNRMSDESPTLAKMILDLLLEKQVLAAGHRPVAAAVDAGTTP
jgi:hypothetical protein